MQSKPLSPVDAILDGTGICRITRIIGGSAGWRAGRAGVTSRRRCPARARGGALVHGAVLHRTIGRAGPNIAGARRAASGL